MGRQSYWNKSIYRRIQDKLEEDANAITNICIRNAEICKSVIDQKTPVKYGGLKASSYSQVNNTDTGISVVVGYSNRKHINLDPISPGYDDITNTELLDILENRPSVSNDVLDIQDAMSDCIENTRRDIEEYWKSKRK